MNGDELRHQPLAERYRGDDKAGLVRSRPMARSFEGIACKGRDGASARRRRAYPDRGSGAELCSGDMLLEALVACAGVTLKAVATSIGIELRSPKWWRRASRLSRHARRRQAAPVGFTDIRLKFDLDTDALQDQRYALKLTERYASCCSR